MITAEKLGVSAGRHSLDEAPFSGRAGRATRFGQLAEPAFLPLLELEEALGIREPLAAVAGITHEGRPILIDLLAPETSHVLVLACQAWGKSTLLRTLLGSLCLRARPWQMGVLGVDASGNELSILEALPHRMAPLACDVTEAGRLLAWLEEETAARLDRRIACPAILLVVDDMGWLADPDQASNLRRMVRTLRVGWRAGIHVLAAIQQPLAAELAPLLDVQGSVLAVGQDGPTRGVFTFSSRGWQRTVQAAYLSARDLNRLVAGISGRAVGPGGTKAQAGAGEP
ncbi:MAG: FtsK/SpoIIIE domain-containing protein [Anaerolineales bacterium]